MEQITTSDELIDFWRCQAIAAEAESLDYFVLVLAPDGSKTLTYAKYARFCAASRDQTAFTNNARKARTNMEHLRENRTQQMRRTEKKNG